MKFKKDKYFLVEKNALPEVFHKVMQVKEGIKKGIYPSVNRAVKELNLSRSAYYKYRNAVFTYQGTDFEAVDIFQIIIEIDLINLMKIFKLLEEYHAEMIHFQQSVVTKGICSLQIMCRKIAAKDAKAILNFLKKENGIVQVTHTAIRE